MKKSILFVAVHRRGRSPSQRFRYEQYTDWLSENDWVVQEAHVMTPQIDAFFYKPGNYLKKVLAVFEMNRRRSRHSALLDSSEIVFVQREALLTGSVSFERKVKARKKKLVFDFDDSIWLQNVSSGNRLFSFMKNPDKTRKIIELSDVVFAGNEYLAEFARQYSPKVCIVPTTIDTDAYLPDSARWLKPEDSPIVLGWSGSVTTVQHFEYAVDALRLIKNKYGSRVQIKLIGDGNYSNAELGVTGSHWNAATELTDLNSFDIGIMPLPNDEWAKGKCGLKGLQYMALEIPTVMSPVGVNTEIISHGVNGLLAASPDEWVQALSMLIDSPELRQRLGQAARQSVIERYSVLAWRDVYLREFNALVGAD